MPRGNAEVVKKVFHKNLWLVILSAINAATNIHYKNDVNRSSGMLSNIL